MDVPFSMVVTAAVSHFEMSALNAAAPLNAVGEYVNAVDVEPVTRKKETQNCQRTTSSWNKQLNKKTKRWKSDVLASMVATRAVSHFEMSALNAAASSNAVGVDVNADDVQPETRQHETQNC